MSNQKSLSVVQQRENILAVACSSLAQDLRKIAPADYVLFFSTNKMPELFDQICGMFEQHFPSGNMSFACTGGYFNSWVEPPVVGLDVEFETPDVFAFFRLYFAEKGVAVDLHHIAYEETHGDAKENTERLSLCLADAAGHA